MKQKHDFGIVKNEYSKGYSDTDKGESENDDKNNFLVTFLFLC